MLRNTVFTSLVALALAVVVLTGCATSSVYQSAVVTATEADKQFAATGQMYDTLYSAGKLSHSEYAGWSIFAYQYKLLSSQVHVALKAGATAQDAGEVVPLVQRLATELALYYAYGLEKGGS